MNALLLLFCASVASIEGGSPSPASPAPEASPSTAPGSGADLALLADVRRIASQVEALRGARFPSPPTALRASDETRAAATRARASAMVPASTLAPRGRAWADLGLGPADTPARLIDRLASDLPGIVVDPGNGYLLVAPDVLTDRDFSSENPDDPSAALLMATGLRPDEPIVAHGLVHALQRQRKGNDLSRATTDRLLTRAAWSEGESNLLAIRYLFRSMGIGDEVFQHEMDPAGVLGGRLLGTSIESLPGAQRALLGFVYQEGFAQTVTSYRKGGWKAVEQAATSRTSSRDLLHPERGSSNPVPSRAPAPPLSDQALALADEDVLGEQGVVALVSALTGKEDLALAAADGWIGDSLQRWEFGGGQEPAEGITVWDTAWRSEGDAEEFAYAFGRCIEDGLAGTRPEPAANSVWRVGGQTYRVARNQTRVLVRVAPAGLDQRIEGARRPSKTPGR